MTVIKFDGLHLDKATNQLMTVDYEHHEIHGGSAYFVVYSALKSDTGLIEVRIQTPNTKTWAHMVIAIDAALAATAQLWKGTTKTDVSGNRITPMNRNHNSSNTSGLTICHTPAGAEGGTAALTQYMGAASTNGRVNTGGGTGNRGEFILQQNQSYLIRVTSRADNNALSIILDWYEHAHKN